MNPLVKATWVAALRSGEYQQGQGFLRNSRDQYCCLGVLCDLHSKAHAIPWISTGYLSNFHQLPNQVKNWVGITEEQQDRLVALNDKNGETFLQIADRLEQDSILESK